MTLKTNMSHEINQLGRLTSEEGPIQIQVNVGNGSLCVELMEVDSLACAFYQVTLHSAKLAAASSEQLQKIAATYVAGINYLLEPLHLMENGADAIQLRSTPSTGQNGITYYELLVSPQQVHFARYAKVAKQARTITASHVTREVLQRLTVDIIGAVENL